MSDSRVFIPVPLFNQILIEPLLSVGYVKVKGEQDSFVYPLCAQQGTHCHGIIEVVDGQLNFLLTELLCTLVPVGDLER